MKLRSLASVLQKKIRNLKATFINSNLQQSIAIAKTECAVQKQRAAAGTYPPQEELRLRREEQQRAAAEKARIDSMASESCHVIVQ